MKENPNFINNLTGELLHAGSSPKWVKGDLMRSKTTGVKQKLQDGISQIGVMINKRVQSNSPRNHRKPRNGTDSIGRKARLNAVWEEYDRKEGKE